MLQRRTPLKRTGGLKAKRAGPRTGRMKPNARFPDAKVKAYWSSLDRRSAVCNSTQDTVLHHILARLPQKLSRTDHRFVVFLYSAHTKHCSEPFQHRVCPYVFFYVAAITCKTQQSTPPPTT